MKTIFFRNLAVFSGFSARRKVVNSRLIDQARDYARFSGMNSFQIFIGRSGINVYTAHAYSCRELL
jgi:hypothetical protein